MWLWNIKINIKYSLTNEKRIMAEIDSDELMDGSALLVSGDGYESEELEICLMVKRVSFHEWI